MIRVAMKNAGNDLGGCPEKIFLNIDKSHSHVLV
jgi:hypothetical protein